MSDDGSDEAARAQTQPAEDEAGDERDEHRSGDEEDGAAPRRGRVVELSFGDIVPSVGEMCQRPNKADVAKIALRSPHSSRAEASSTPRKANSSGITVKRRIGTATSNNRRDPDTSARESSKKLEVAGITATMASTEVVMSSAAIPYTEPSRASARARRGRPRRASLSSRARRMCRTTE